MSWINRVSRLGAGMSDRTKNILFLIAGCAGIFVAALGAGLLIYYLLHGDIQIPAVTQNNFWSLINTLIISLAIPAILNKAAEMNQQSRKSGEQLNQRIDQLDYTIKNGGGTRIGVIAGETAANILLSAQEPRNPESRERADDPPVEQPDPPSVRQDTPHRAAIYDLPPRTNDQRPGGSHS